MITCGGAVGLPSEVHALGHMGSIPIPASTRRMNNMDSFMQYTLRNKKIKESLEKIVIETINSKEFISKFKDKFMKAVLDDIHNGVEDLMDNAWAGMEREFNKSMVKNFKIVLQPKDEDDKK
jgi:hypothetical protein